MARNNRKRENEEKKASSLTEACNKEATRAYWFAAIGLLPIIGLVFGPIAIVLGYLARKKAKTDPDFSMWGPVWASIYFGWGITFCNSVGLALIIYSFYR